MTISNPFASLDNHIRASIARLIYGLIGGHPNLVGDFGTLTCGKEVRLANTLVNLNGGSVTVEDYAIFGHNVMLLTGSHEFHEGLRVSMFLAEKNGRWPGNTAEVPTEGKDIIVGRGSWIASGAIVLGGVKIGHNVIVAAGAIVVRDIPDFQIVGGVPAKPIGDTRDKRSVLVE
jgi:acetyltransferase-like isoleucine patch superfamily enzyme